MARLARIHIHPLKSFPPVAVSEAVVLPSGALQYDRQFALFDADGAFVNGKRTPRVHGLETSFDLPPRVMTLVAGGTTRAFHLDDDRPALEQRLGELLGVPVHLRENPDAGFPDDTVAPGPTIIGASTLAEVASWFDLPLDDVRLRFRANLEIEGEEPFWEDHLYGEEGDVVRFRIGDVELAGTNPCQRCVVPTRSPSGGARYPQFTRIFEERRYETLPYWATRSRFDHFYRLAVNTRLAVGSSGGTIRVGDEVRITQG